MSTTLIKDVSPIRGGSSVYNYKCIVTENSYDVGTNSSNVTIDMSIKGPWSPSFSNWTTYYGIIVDGEIKKNGSSSPSVNNSYVQLLTWTGDIQHNDNGSKIIDIDVYLYHNNPSSYLPEQYKASSSLYMGEVVLTDIPRESGISSITQTVDVGEDVTVDIDCKSSEFTHHVRFYIDDTYTSEKFVDVKTSQSFTIPASWLNAMPSSTSCIAYCNVATFNSDGVQVAAHVTKSFKITVPDDIVPTIGDITFTPDIINGNNILVKGKNKLTISVSDCEPGTGSSIKNYTFSSTNPIYSKTVTEPSVSITSVSSAGALTFTVKVTDVRGRSSSKSSTITCYDYFTPYFMNVKAYRANSNGDEDINGAYLKCEYVQKYASVNATNSTSVIISYNGVSTNETLIDLNGDTTTTYKVYLTISDIYGGVNKSSTITVLGQSRIFNVTSDGTGFAIGKMAEENELFECRWPAKFNDKINFGSGGAASLYLEQFNELNSIYLRTGQSTSAGQWMGLGINKESVHVPNAGNSGLINLGATNNKWNQLYAANSTISTSDRNQKKDIEDMSDVQEKLFNQLKPVTYKMISGTSDRTHYGFISQDVENALGNVGLDGKDFAGFCKDIRKDDLGKGIIDENGDQEYDYSLRYSEFIALNTYMIQKLQERIIELEQTIKELKEAI